MPYEYFRDESYYGMYAVREVGNSDFNGTINTETEKEARFVCDALNELEMLEKLTSGD